MRCLPIQLACMMALMVLSGHAMADDMAIFLTLEISKGLEVTDYDISVVEGQTVDDTSEPISSGMRTEILTMDSAMLFSKNFYPSFILLTDPPEDVDVATVFLALPYYSYARYIKIYDNDTERLSIDLQESLCNSNQICDNFENHYSCPGDCSIYSEDGVCASVSFDGGCDPDCPPRIDLDCSCPNGVCEDWEGYRYCPDDCDSGISDGYCDRVRDGRCDPDCRMEEDTDCTCPDGTCQAFESPETCPQDCAQAPPEAGNGFIQTYWHYIIVLLIVALVIILVAYAMKGKSRKPGKWDYSYRPSPRS